MSRDDPIAGPIAPADQTTTPWTGGYSTVRSIPNQKTYSYLTEYKDSRQITVDLQRWSMVETYLIRGTPDVAALDPVTARFRVGEPHPWFPNKDEGAIPSYITRIEYKHHSFGTDQPDSAGQDESHAWTKMIVYYMQRPCPAAYEESETSALTTYNEWYSRPFTQDEINDIENYPGDLDAEFVPVPLTFSPEASIPIPRPVSVYRRRYLRVALGPLSKRRIRGEVGKVNGFPWRGDPVGVWLFDGAQFSHIAGDPDPSDNGPEGQAGATAWYEVILTFRSDPLRKHRHATPKIAPGTQKILDPRSDENRTWTYEDLHNFRKLVPYSTMNWDRELIPFSQQSYPGCTPEDVPDSDEPEAA